MDRFLPASPVAASLCAGLFPSPCAVGAQLAPTAAATGHPLCRGGFGLRPVARGRTGLAARSVR